MTEPFPLTPIPLDLVFAGRTIGGPSLSPLGDTLVFPAKWGSEAGLFRVDSLRGAERLISSGVAPALGRGAFGRTVAWFPDGSEVAFAGADGNLYRVESSGGAPNLLGDTGEGRSAGAIQISPDGAWIAAVVDFAEIWIWPLTGASSAPWRVDAGRNEFVNDPSFSPDSERLVWQAWNTPDMAWDGAAAIIAEIRADATAADLVEVRAWGAIQQPRLLSDGRMIALRDDEGWLNLWIDEEPLVSEANEHGLPTWGSGQSSYAIAPDEQRVAFWRNEGGFGTLNIVDIETGQLVEVDRGIFSQLDWRGDTLAALRSGARTPPEIVTYGVARHKGASTRRRIAFSGVAGWDRYDLPEPDLVEIAVDDQLTLHARHYPVPGGLSVRGMLVWVHGGPTDQTLVEWNARLSYWWTRGYSSLVVDPRGSTGHGRAYQRALNGQWGAIDVDDTATLISYAHVRGWATPETTVVTGSSAGGFTALGVVGRYPELVCGGIVRYPVTDLTALSDGTHRFEEHYPLTLVGDPDDTEHYRRLSAAAYARSVERPLLIFHGDQDEVVPLASTIEFVDLVNDGSYDGPATLVVLEGEGHGIRQPAHQRLEYELSAESIERWTGDARAASAARAAAAQRAVKRSAAEVTARRVGADTKPDTKPDTDAPKRGLVRARIGRDLDPEAVPSAAGNNSEPPVDHTTSSDLQPAPVADGGEPSASDSEWSGDYEITVGKTSPAVPAARAATGSTQDQPIDEPVIDEPVIDEIAAEAVAADTAQEVAGEEVEGEEVADEDVEGAEVAGETSQGTGTQDTTTDDTVTDDTVTDDRSAGNTVTDDRSAGNTVRTDDISTVRTSADAIRAGERDLQESVVEAQHVEEVLDDETLTAHDQLEGEDSLTVSGATLGESADGVQLERSVGSDADAPDAFIDHLTDAIGVEDEYRSDSAPSGSDESEPGVPGLETRPSGDDATNVIAMDDATDVIAVDRGASDAIIDVQIANDAIANDLTSSDWAIDDPFIGDSSSDDAIGDDFAGADLHVDDPSADGGTLDDHEDGPDNEVGPGSEVRRDASGDVDGEVGSETDGEVAGEVDGQLRFDAFLSDGEIEFESDDNGWLRESDSGPAS